MLEKCFSSLNLTVFVLQKLKCTLITQQQYKELLKHIQDRIFVILFNIDVLIAENGKIYDQGFVVLKETRYNIGIASLYSHAIEQLGKLLLIKDCKFNGTNYDLAPIEYKFYDHDKKIDRALAVLDNKCKDIFVNVGPATSSKLDFDMRLKLLHSDIDKSGNVVETPVIDVDKLKNAVGLFKSEYKKF